MQARRIFFILMFIGFFMPLVAQNVTIGTFNYTLNASDKTAVLLGYQSPALAVGSLIIPATVTDANGVDYSVTEIGIWAFAHCANLTGELVIPSSVTMIGHGAFISCSGLTGSLVIPNSVTILAERAFYLCNGFNGSLTISSSLKEISTDVFNGCSGLTGELTIPSSVTKINSQAFNGCKGFTGSLTFPSSVETIESFAFQDCSGFKGFLTLPTSVTSIGGEAFSGCNGLTGSFDIPSSLPTISSGVFANCSGFTGSLIIPSSVTAIGTYSFYNCSNVSTIIVSNISSTLIGDFAFEECLNLQSLTFLGNTPPTLSTTPKVLGIQSCTNIFVPNGTLSAYKQALGFADYSSQIYEEKDRVLAFSNAAPVPISGCSYNYTGTINRNGSTCVTYSPSGFPSGWQLVSNPTGGFTLTGDAPTQSFTGTITATVAISGAEIIQSISFVSPPTFTSTHITTATVNQPYSYTVAAQDLDKETLTISFVGTLPTGLTLGSTVNDLALGTAIALLSGSITTAGSYPVTLIVTDAKGASAQTSFTIVANSQYTITFDTDGGTAQAEQIYTNGNSEPLLVSTSKPGYTFLYWSINGVKVVNTGELTAGDKTVKAVWEICQNNSFAVNSYDGVDKPYLWSTFLDVPDKSMETLFGNKPIKYIEDTNGSKWYPASSGNVSEFANYVNGSGYAVYPDGDFVWNMCGKERNFESELISLKGPNNVRNIIGSPYSKKVLIDDVLDQIQNELDRSAIKLIMAPTLNDGYNLYRVYESQDPESYVWAGQQRPTFEPGQAYYVYYYPNSTVSFSYPSLLPMQGAPTLKALTNSYMPQNVRSLDRFMLLSIAGSAIDLVYEEGAEWHVYSNSGALIGKDYVDSNSLMMIDGYDLKDGELMELRYYSPTSQKEHPVTVLSWTPKSSTSGSTVALEFYHMADLIAEHLTVSTTPVSENTLLAKASSISVYPNPAKDKVTLTLNLDDQAKVYGSVYNTSGEYLMTAIDDVIAAGKHNLDINVSLLPSGMYLLKIQVGDRVELVKLVVEK